MIHPFRFVIYICLATMTILLMSSCGSSCATASWRNTNVYYGTIYKAQSNRSLYHNHQEKVWTNHNHYFTRTTITAK